MTDRNRPSIYIKRNGDRNRKRSPTPSPRRLTVAAAEASSSSLSPVWEGRRGRRHSRRSCANSSEQELQRETMEMKSVTYSMSSSPTKPRRNSTINRNRDANSNSDITSPDSLQRMARLQRRHSRRHRSTRKRFTTEVPSPDSRRRFLRFTTEDPSPETNTENRSVQPRAKVCVRRYGDSGCNLVPLEIVTAFHQHEDKEDDDTKSKSKSKSKLHFYLQTQKHNQFTSMHKRKINAQRLVNSVSKPPFLNNAETHKLLGSALSASTIEKIDSRLNYTWYERPSTWTT